LAPQEVFFENGKIGAILGGGPPFFPPFPPPPFFSPLSSNFLLSSQVYIQLNSKTLFYLHFSAIKDQKILSTLQRGRHLLQACNILGVRTQMLCTPQMKHLCKPHNCCAARLLRNLGLQLDFLCQNGEVFRKMSSTDPNCGINSRVVG
jgi:hypothetical protein